MSEKEIRKKVKALQELYFDLIGFVLINAFLILIWLVFDQSGTFWPKYVLLVLGIALGCKAYGMGLMSLFFDHVFFLSSEWEEQKVNEIIGHREIQRKIRLHRDGRK